VSKKTGKTLLKLALVGAKGRMGREIQALAAECTEFKTTVAIDRKEEWTKIQAKEVDVVLDFSSPAGFCQALEWCVKMQRPLVSGTTGLTNPDLAQLKKGATKVPLLYSANMSLGIALLSSMLRSLQDLDGWDFQIDEVHHSKKVDRPSGTALYLQQVLTEVTGRNLPLPNSIRGGGVPGIHQVWAMGPDEALVLQHTAFQRKVFARGALAAARWIFDKKDPGLYDLSDLYQKK